MSITVNMGYAHVEAALSLEDRAGVLRLVIEYDVRAECAHERKLLRGTGTGDDLHPRCLRELYYRAARECERAEREGKVRQKKLTRRQVLQLR